MKKIKGYRTLRKGELIKNGDLFGCTNPTCNACKVKGYMSEVDSFIGVKVGTSTFEFKFYRKKD